MIGRDHGVSTLRYASGFACQQGLLKTFPGRGYIHSEDGEVWLWHSLVNLYICLTNLSCYSSITLPLGLNWWDGSLSTLCHGLVFSCQQRVLETFPGPWYICLEYGVVWPWHSLVSLYMAYRFILLRHNLFGLRVDREGWRFENSMSWFWVWFLAEGAQNLSWPWLYPLRGWGGLFITFTVKFVYMAYHFMLLRLNPFGFRVDRKRWWFEHSMSWSRVCLSGEGAKNVCCPWLSLLQWLGSLSMTFTGTSVDMTRYFILRRLNLLGLRVDREGWWFKDCLLWLWVFLSAEGAKNVSSLWLSRLLRWGSVIMIFNGKYV